MILPAKASEPVRRHDLAFVEPEGWRSVLAARPDVAALPLTARWADEGWPLIGRRAGFPEPAGVALGLPLPPSAGRQRIAVVLQLSHLRAVAPPPALSAASPAAPRRWRPTLDTILRLAADHGAEAEVFGSLAWQALTGLDYLTDGSDLDLIVRLGADTDPLRLAAALARIDAAAPMRIDGEFVRSDGIAVHWREVLNGAREILVKTAAGVALLDASRLASGGRAS